MPRPRNKLDLLNQAQAEYENLINLLQSLEKDSILKGGACGEWSIKDILAHLDVWGHMMLSWYEVGMYGNKPDIPAKGYTWKTLPDLNEKIFIKNKDRSLDEILSSLNNYQEQIIKIIGGHNDKELFTKKFYPWTGTTSLGAYLISSTSSHYIWALNLIQKFLKIMKAS